MRNSELSSGCMFSPGGSSIIDHLGCDRLRSTLTDRTPRVYVIVRVEYCPLSSHADPESESAN